MMIQLTDENGNKFYLNADFIERITTRQYQGGSAIELTTGRWIECIESADEVAKKIHEATSG